jgi:hypothetical protein
MMRVRSFFPWVLGGFSLVSSLGMAQGCSALREGELASDAGVDGTVLADGAIVPTLPDGAPDLDAAKEDGGRAPGRRRGGRGERDRGPQGRVAHGGRERGVCGLRGGPPPLLGGTTASRGAAGRAPPNRAPIPIRAEDGGGFLRGVAEVHASYRHACARLLDGTFACWGFNGEYQLGDFTRDSSPSPDRTAFARIVKDALSAGPLKGPAQRSGVGRVSAGALYSAAIGDFGPGLHVGLRERRQSGARARHASHGRSHHAAARARAAPKPAPRGRSARQRAHREPRSNPRLCPHRAR